MRSTPPTAAAFSTAASAAEGREIPYSEVGRGVALPDGRLLPLFEDDLARLPLPTKHTITVVGFIEPHGVVPISYDRRSPAAHPAQPSLPVHTTRRWS